MRHANKKKAGNDTWPKEWKYQIKKKSERFLLYSLHNGLTLLHKYTSTERWPEFTRVDPKARDTITWDTTSVVDNSRYPTGLPPSY